MSKENNKDEKIIKDAQYRKGLSIAFFNATNSAIALIGNQLRAGESAEALLKQVVEVRDFFLEEHKNYYAKVIANVGQNYDVEKAIEQLKSVTSLAELNNVWRMFSEDERHDGDIRKVAAEVKKQFPNENT